MTETCPRCGRPVAGLLAGCNTDTCRTADVDAELRLYGQEDTS